MGELIPMSRANATFVARPHTGGDAEILFFTGVRYHRIDDDVPAPQITRSRRRLEKAKSDGVLQDALRPDQQV